MGSRGFGFRSLGFEFRGFGLRVVVIPKYGGGIGGGGSLLEIGVKGLGSGCGGG